MMDRNEGRAILETTPAVLGTWLGALPAAWLDFREGPDTFSPRDVVGHLIHGEGTDWIPRLRLMREFGETKSFEAFDRVSFKEAIRGRAIGDLLEEFGHLRRVNLAALDSFALEDKDLATRGLHPALGTVTIGQLLATWVTHDLNHIGQIARVMARRQDEAVGPWKAYLGILQWNPKA